MYIASVVFVALAVIVTLMLLAPLAGRYRKGSAVVGNKKPLGLTTLRVDAPEAIVDQLIASFAQERGYLVDSRDAGRGLIILAQPARGIQRVGWFFSVFVSPGSVVEIGAHSPLDNFPLPRPFGDPASRRERFANFLLSYLSTKLGEGKVRNVTPVPADYVKRVMSRRGYPGREFEALAIGMGVFGVVMAYVMWKSDGVEIFVIFPAFLLAGGFFWIVGRTIGYHARLSNLEDRGEISTYQRWILRAMGFLLAATFAAEALLPLLQGMR